MALKRLCGRRTVLSENSARKMKLEQCRCRPSLNNLFNIQSVFTLSEFELSAMRVDNCERNLVKTLAVNAKQWSQIALFGALVAKDSLQLNSDSVRNTEPNSHTRDCCNDPRLQPNQSDYDIVTHVLTFHVLVVHSLLLMFFFSSIPLPTNVSNI